MKKLLVLFIVLLLAGCSPKKEDFYNLTFDGITIAVGYDNTDLIKENNVVDDYSYELNKKEEEIINHLVLYRRDLNNPNSLMIDNYSLSKGIIETCNDLNGELKSNNGNYCLLHKTVDNKENIIVLTGNILNNDIDDIDRIEVFYK